MLHDVKIKKSKPEFNTPHLVFIFEIGSSEIFTM